jgi:hypothetical protein
MYAPPSNPGQPLKQFQSLIAEKIFIVTDYNCIIRREIWLITIKLPKMPSYFFSDNTLLRFRNRCKNRQQPLITFMCFFQKSYHPIPRREIWVLTIHISAGRDDTTCPSNLYVFAHLNKACKTMHAPFSRIFWNFSQEWLKPGGQILVSEYVHGKNHPNHPDEYIEYIKDRGYQGSILRNSISAEKFSDNFLS